MDKYSIEKEKSINNFKHALKIMRITLFLLFFGILFTQAANGYSQGAEFTLDLKSTSIKKICEEIESNSDFRFIFAGNAKMIINKKVDITANSPNIEEILNIMLSNTELSYKILDDQVVIYRDENKITSKIIEEITSELVIQQQKKQISGTISDKDGESIIGANIIEKGTTNGTVTDIDGSFTLSVENNAILLISYIGYLTQEVNITGKTTFDIILQEDTQALDEVVVVGYGTQRKETLTGSIASIGSKEIMDTKSNDLVANMAGKIPGLHYRPNSGEPGDFNISLSIRGYGTPVIVIDGVVRQQGGAAEVAQLNSEDIESISLLKDASAAIYGMNASNGVMIITTKKGKNEKVKFSYSGMVGVKKPTGLPETVDAYTYRLMANEWARNMGSSEPYDSEILELYKKNEYPYMDYDWLNLYTKKITDPIHTHTFSARGGTDKLNFYTSLGFNSDEGLFKPGNQYYKRFNIRTNLSAELTKNLKMNLMLSGRIGKTQHQRDATLETIKCMMINDRGVGPFTESGKYTAILPDLKNPALKSTGFDEGYRRWENSNITSQLDVTYSVPFAPGLEINLLGAYDTRNENYSILTRKVDLYDYFEDTYVTSLRDNRYQNDMNLYQRYYLKLQANYSLKFGERHSINLMAATEASQQRFDFLSAQRTYEDVFTYDIINQASTANQTNGGYREFRRLAAFIGRINYDYQGKYLVEGMLRRDGSYRYAPSKRWAFFPSVSVGWRISEEDFFKDNISFVNNLKLRASYGESGRDQGSAHEYMAAYTADSQRNYIFKDGVVTTAMVEPGVVTDKLTWVTAKFLNAAVDMNLLRNKLSFTFEYFTRKNSGLLANRQSSAPNTFGASFPQENINSDMNMGLELALNYKDKIGDFNYSIGANITFSRLKRLHVERAPFTSQWDRWKNGEENRYVQGRGWIYDHDGQYTSLDQYETAPLCNGGNRGNSMMRPGGWMITDANGDGRLSSDDQLPINWSYGAYTYNSGATAEWDGINWSRINPPMQYGFPIEVSYKSWDMNLLLTGSSMYCLNITIGDVWGYGRYPTMNSRFLDRWHTVGREVNGQMVYDDPLDPNAEWIRGYFPALRTYNYSNTTDGYATTVWRPKVAYLRLRNVELGYTIPKRVTNKAGFDNCRLYLNGFNLLTFAPKIIRMYDPEMHEGDWDVGLTHPMMKAMNVGINLTF